MFRGSITELVPEQPCHASVVLRMRKKPPCAGTAAGGLWHGREAMDWTKLRSGPGLSHEGNGLRLLVLARGRPDQGRERADEMALVGKAHFLGHLGGGAALFQKLPGRQNAQLILEGMGRRDRAKP